MNRHDPRPAARRRRRCCAKRWRDTWRPFGKLMPTRVFVDGVYYAELVDVSIELEEKSNVDIKDLIGFVPSHFPFKYPMTIFIAEAAS